jgi:hypothetical protein
LIYKEAELDIDPEAGGTDLCPFDCECCKSRSSPREGYMGFILTLQASSRSNATEHEGLFSASPYTRLSRYDHQPDAWNDIDIHSLRFH